MTRLGFVIDQRSCIGCNACTVACKTEHGVELGVFRTWVKHIEQGTFPDTRRFFSVMRCNHCDDAPCIEVCPVTALFRREDGIGMLVGLLLPAIFAALFLVVGGLWLLAAGGVLALIGLWFYEDAWIRAGQSVPLS